MVLDEHLIKLKGKFTYFFKYFRIDIPACASVIPQPH